MTGYLFPRGHVPSLEDIKATCAIDEETHCWLWQHTLSGNGQYGSFYKFGQMQWAHRWTYELANGPILDGLTVDHLCFRPTCVNPDHLRLLTARENAALNARRLKTSCHRGHEFTEDNTILRESVSGNGYMTRACRECSRIAQRKYDAKRRAA